MLSFKKLKFAHLGKALFSTRVRHTQMLINNEWVEATTGKTFETINPATEEKIADLQEGGAKDVDRAVQAARRAFDHGPWYKKMSGADRRKVLLRLADLIEENMEEIATLESIDNGMPIMHARHGHLPFGL